MDNIVDGFQCLKRVRFFNVEKNNIVDGFQCLKKVRFFNVEKNKNAPFFGMYYSVNLKKVRFFVIFEEKVLQDEYCHMLI